MSPASRLLGLLSLLQVRRQWGGVELADRLAISPRTVRRDVDRLREMGYTIRTLKGPDGGYQLDAGTQLPPLLFDDDQAVALAVALRTAAVSGVDVGEAAAQALTTVRQVLPARLRHRVDAVAVTAMAHPNASGSTPVDADVLLAVSAAVRGREVLRADYRSAADQGAEPTGPERMGPPRRLEPHALVTVAARWYLIAWDLTIDDWRLFRLDRLSLKMPTGVRFAQRPLPGGDPAAFVAARLRGSPTGAWACTGEATLALTPHEVVPFAGEGLVVDLGDGRCRLTSGAWSWVALAASLGRFDCALTDVEPAALREACKTLARRYDDASP